MGYQNKICVTCGRENDYFPPARKCPHCGGPLITVTLTNLDLVNRLRLYRKQTDFLADYMPMDIGLGTFQAHNTLTNDHDPSRDFESEG